MKIKICFISLYSYPIFNPENRTAFGGSEVRVATLAKALAKIPKFQVYMIVFDHGQPDVEIIDGVTLIKWEGKHLPAFLASKNENRNTKLSFRVISGFKIHFRAFIQSMIVAGKFTQFYKLLLDIAFAIIYFIYQLKKVTEFYGNIGIHVIGKSDIEIYDKVNPDFFLFPGNNQVAAELAYYCQKNRKRLILLGCSDNDFEKIPKDMLLQRDTYGSLGFLRKYAAENAAFCIVQSTNQARMLLDNYGQTSAIIKNPITFQEKIIETKKEYDLLWIGKSDNVKQPEIIIRLAGDLPQFNIMMVLNYSNEGIHNYCTDAAKKLENLTILEYVPFPEIEEFFMKSRLLVNTSRFEGFPNTFLQAVKYRVPIISLKVNPDNFLSTYRCGNECADDYNLFKKQVQESLKKKHIFPTECMNYVRENHDLNNIVSKYDKLITDLWDSNIG